MHRFHAKTKLAGRSSGLSLREPHDSSCDQILVVMQKGGCRNFSRLNPARRVLYTAHVLRARLAKPPSHP
ncbi:hypothetical protein CCHR01_02206 [Colletotrichum chrysophilum]|uniref:Uncharacterized protein n=1 Tax=Colletotrichum chrysophilum TaxID=1836956 RepID=A0AAD9AXI9_9PEZI|nr:hypothetical protein CCHR01_02206 [Colletotrichum chrysophilum]